MKSYIIKLTIHYWESCEHNSGLQSGFILIWHPHETTENQLSLRLDKDTANGSEFEVMKLWVRNPVWLMTHYPTKAVVLL